MNRDILAETRLAIWRSTRLCHAGIPESTLSSIFKGFGEHYHWTCSREIFKSSKDLLWMQKIETGNLTEKEKGYLVGLFLGDGYAIYSKKDRHYNTEFYLNSIKDLDIQEFLISILTKMNLFTQISKDPRYNVNRIRVSSRMFFEFLQKEVNVLETEGNSADKDFLLGVISGFIDAEGCVYYGTICLTQKDEGFMRQAESICKLFGVKCSLRQRDNTNGRKIWRMYISTTFKYLPHASKKMGRVYRFPSIASRNAYKGREVWSSRWAHNP